MVTGNKATIEKTMQMGLGEALERLLRLHNVVSQAVGSPAQVDEYNMILEALNETKLDLGFDCDLDGVPDTVAIFAESAKTGCCRILPADTSRRKSKPTSRRRR
jgi:hypothetical protein